MGRTESRRPSDMLEIITAESSQRPDGSPPTYDDAMKFVNDAFDNSEDSENEEPPPTYSPNLKEGEQSCPSYNVDARSNLSRGQTFIAFIRNNISGSDSGSSSSHNQDNSEGRNNQSDG